MWHLIKYLPVEWFPRDFPCTPRGPTIRRARPVTIRIAGSELHLKVPRHSPSSSSMQQYNLFLGRDTLAQGLFSAHGREPMVNNDHWGFASALARRWAFWGPWMSGCKAELHFGITVVGRMEGFEFANSSFFHPRAFEAVITQYLNDRYGHERWGSSEDDPRPRHAGPFDWQIHDHLPVFSASCNVYHTHRDGKTPNRTPEQLLFFPVTDQHFVRVYMRQYLYARDEQDNLTFDPNPIQALQDAVFNSMTLELSPEAQASYDKVKAECPDMRLTETFPPLNWPTKATTPGEDLSPNLQDNPQLVHGR